MSKWSAARPPTTREALFESCYENRFFLKTKTLADLSGEGRLFRLAGHNKSQSGLISNLRNFTTPLSFATPLASLLPRPCWSAMCPLGSFAF